MILTYFFWSKNSMDKLMISSSAMILLSSSATSPLSSLEPLVADGQRYIYKCWLKNNTLLMNKNVNIASKKFTINWMLSIKIPSPFHLIWITNAQWIIIDFSKQKNVQTIFSNRL